MEELRLKLLEIALKSPFAHESKDSLVKIAYQLEEYVTGRATARKAVTPSDYGLTHPPYPGNPHYRGTTWGGADSISARTSGGVAASSATLGNVGQISNG